MGSDWQLKTLADVDVSLIDCVHKTPSAAEEGYPYIAIPQMKEGRIDFDANPRMISEADLVEWTKKADPQKDDVVLSRRCNPGETAYVTGEKKFALGQNLVLLRSNGNQLFPPFLRWLVRGPQWWDQVGKFLNVGAVFDSLRCADIPNFELPIPPLNEQKKIAEILSAFDDKIELNRQINTTLESMAQALFKSWFVDFDPVIDNALAAGNPIPDELSARAERRNKLAGQRVCAPDEGARRASTMDGASEYLRENPDNPHPPLSADIQQLFPSSFVFTEALGWVPEGWDVAPLANITTELRRGISPKYLEEGGVRVVNQKCIRNHLIDFGLARRNDPAQRKVDGRELQIGDVLVNSTGVGTLGRMAQVLLLDELTVVDSHVTVVRPNPLNYLPYTFGQSMLSIESRIEAMGEGSTGQTELSRKNLLEYNVLVPNTECQKLAEPLLESLAKKISSNMENSKSLTNLRDLLLPKLLSGKLQIPEAEQQLAEVI